MPSIEKYALFSVFGKNRLALIVVYLLLGGLRRFLAVTSKRERRGVIWLVHDRRPCRRSRWPIPPSTSLQASLSFHDTDGSRYSRSGIESSRMIGKIFCKVAISKSLFGTVCVEGFETREQWKGKKQSLNLIDSHCSAELMARR